MNKFLCCSFFFLIISNLVFSQTSKIIGKVFDSSNNLPLKGAEILLKNSHDTLKSYGVISNSSGQFSFINIPRGIYLIKIRFIGYKLSTLKVIADKDVINLNDIKLQQSTTIIKDVTISEKAIRTQQLGDTTQYNAGAFKTKPDADAVDLVTKMPGITVDNGTVKSQNENIQQVTIDGKPFFGEDPSLALKSIPAEIIEKIQVFDKLSDQSQFTGFDDGNTVKTMNIITRTGRNNGQFGKIYGGYGTDDRYLAGGYVNYFKGDQRISLIGMTNNINMQNFSSQDLLGIQGGNGRSGRNFMGGMQPGGGGFSPPGGTNNFLVNQQSGISSTNSIGLNYINNIGSKIKITGSYFFNNLDNNKNTSLTRNYFNSDSLNDETNNSSNNNYNHRFNVRFEYNPDSSNSIIMTPKLYIQLNNANNQIIGEYFKTTQLDANYFNNYNSENSGYTFNNNLLLRHKFSKKGRTISLNLGTDINDKSGNGNLNSGNTSYVPDTSLENNTSQKIDTYTKVYTLSSSVSYTEPVGTNSQLQINYNPSYSKSVIYQKLYNKNILTQSYDLLDTNLTNDFNSNYVNQRSGVSYRFRKNKLNFSTGINYQYYELTDNQSFPSTNKFNMFYSNFLPNAQMSYKFSQTSNLRINYRASTTIPSVSQLQNAIDNSNPNMLASGNPDLKQQYVQTVFGNYNLTNLTEGKTFFIYFNASYIEHYIGNSVFHANKDTLINKAVMLYSGGQYTKLINLDKSWNIRSFITYGIPVDAIKCNLNFHTGFQYNMIPGIVDGINNISETYNTSEGIVLSSNMNQNIDFTVLYTANYNIVYNSLQPEMNNNYFSHTATVKLNWIFYKGFFVGGDATNYLYRGLTKAFNQNFFLVDPYIGKKLFKNQSGEIKLSAYDILKENKSITRTITESYIEDSNTKLLQQYFLLTFTYNIKKYKQDVRK